MNSNQDTKRRLVNVNREIKAYYNSVHSKKVRNAVKPGNNQSLWTAVKLAKDCNQSGLPKTMFRNGLEIATDNYPDEFASFFDKKIKN